MSDDGLLYSILNLQKTGATMIEISYALDVPLSEVKSAILKWLFEK